MSIPAATIKLHSYWRSTTSYRVRIALHLKGVDFETVPVNLVEGAQRTDEYKNLNPIAGVPTLILSDKTVLTQSMAILEYLEQTIPQPALLPEDPLAAAKIRAAASVIACDIHPINNLKVINKLKGLGLEQSDTVKWMNDWMQQGLQAYDALLPENTAFSFGDTPSLADLCLIPQLYNAHRWGTDLSTVPRLVEIEKRCLELPSFKSAQPDAQPDAG